MRQSAREQTWMSVTVRWVWAGCLLLILGILLLCQGWDYYAKVTLPWANWLCLGAGTAGLGLLSVMAWLLTRRNHSRKRRLLTMGGVSLIMAALIYYLAAHYAFTAGWDPAFVYQDASNLAYGYTEDLSINYFSQFPNNLLLTILYSWMISLGDALGLTVQEWFVIHFFQCAGYGLMLYLTYDCADRLTDGKQPDAALWCWTVCLLLVGLSPWVAVQYSDTAALILLTAELRLWLKAREGKLRVLWVGLLFLIGSCAYRIKPQTSIFLIAVGLLWIAREIRPGWLKKEWKKTLAAGLTAVLCFAAGTAGVQAMLDKSEYELDPEARFGMSHYFMMGMNETEMGGYSEMDVGISESAATRKERSEINWSVFRERVEAMGIGGLLRQAVRKTLTNYGDGTFAWEQEGMFYSYDSYPFPARNAWLQSVLPGVYISGKYETMVEKSHSTVWRVICQCVWLGVLVLGLSGCLQKKGQEMAVLELTLIGLTLFELLFEARARHLLAYAPFFILMAGMGLPAMARNDVI